MKVIRDENYGKKKAKMKKFPLSKFQERHVLMPNNKSPQHVHTSTYLDHFLLGHAIL